MPSFEWMERADFRKEIEESVRKTANASGMEQYQTMIVERLMSHLSQKRTLRIIEESRKAAYEQRTKLDALNSVQVLVEEASKLARNAGRKIVTLEDFDKAYQNKFCMVWPFC